MTHLDALSHDSDNGRLYNGFPLKETVSEQAGCTRLGLAWEEETGLKVSAGDALFVYNTTSSGRGAAGANGGFDHSVVPWLKARGVAVTSGVRPIMDDRHADHRLVLVALARVSAGRRTARSTGGNGRSVESMGVSPGGRPASGAREHRLAGQSARAVLSCAPILWARL